MNDETLDSPVAIKTFLAGTGNLDLSLPKLQRYAWVARTLKRTGYFSLPKKEKSIIREYIQRTTGYSRAQITRLIEQYRKQHWIGKKLVEKNKFPRKYTSEEVILLANTDEAHQTLSGGATKKLFERAYFVFEDKTYERLSNISVAHIYNLRKSSTYRRKRRHFTKTKHCPINIGERRSFNKTC